MSSTPMSVADGGHFSTLATSPGVTVVTLINHTSHARLFKTKTTSRTLKTSPVFGVVPANESAAVRLTWTPDSAAPKDAHHVNVYSTEASDSTMPTSAADRYKTAMDSGADIVMCSMPVSFLEPAMPLTTAASYNNAALEQQSAATQLSNVESDMVDSALITAEDVESAEMTASADESVPETETETSGNARETTSTIAMQEVDDEEEETPVVQRPVLSTAQPRTYEVPSVATARPPASVRATSDRPMSMATARAMSVVAAGPKTALVPKTAAVPKHQAPQQASQRPPTTSLWRRARQYYPLPAPVVPTATSQHVHVGQLARYRRDMYHAHRNQALFLRAARHRLQVRKPGVLRRLGWTVGDRMSTAIWPAHSIRHERNRIARIHRRQGVAQ